MEVVDEVLCQELSDRRRSAPEANIQSARRFRGDGQCFARAGVEEVEGRATFHLEWRAGVVREHEHRVVVRRVVSPPTLPLQVRPRSALRSEHVAAHDVRPDAGNPSAREEVVGVPGSAGRAVYLAEGPRGDEPLHQAVPRVTEGRVEALALARGVAVERNGQAVDSNSRHWSSPGFRRVGAEGLEPPTCWL